MSDISVGGLNLSGAPITDEPSRFVLGLSLGNLSDRASLCVIRSVPPGAPAERLLWLRAMEQGTSVERKAAEAALNEPHKYECVHLQVWPRGTHYTDILQGVADRVKKRPALANGVLALDITVVGASVGDRLWEQLGNQGLGVVMYEVVGGLTVARDSASTRVPKRELVSIMRSLLEERRFAAGSRLEHGATLMAELQAFRGFDENKTGDQMDWRERDNDDLVLATALACWHAARQDTWLLA
jgi:hypothetical protein